MTKRVPLIIFLSWSTLAVVAGGCSSESSVQPPDANLRTDEPRPSHAGGSPPHPPDQAVSVLIETSHGEITVELNRERAPRTVENFLDYAQRGHYEGTIFHFVEEGFMALGGGYSADGTSKEMRAPIINEAHNGLKNERGSIAMARDVSYEHSATSEFFFNLSDNPSLDHQSRDDAQAYGYCVFGKVTHGWEVLERIAALPVHDQGPFVNTPVQPVTIRAVQRVR